MESQAEELTVDAEPGAGAPTSIPEAHRRALQLEIDLRNLARVLASSLDERRTAVLAAAELARLFEPAVAAIYLLDSAGNPLLAGVGGATDTTSLSVPPALARRALVTKTVASAGADDLLAFGALGGSWADATAAPIVDQGTTVGVLLIATPEHIRTRLRVAVDPALVSTLAELAAAPLRNARRYAEALDEARRDAATGLPNTRAFIEHLVALLGECERAGSELALVLFDLDDFKQINDRGGHPAGDTVLRDTSRVALRALRVGEEIFRVGGDEFAVVVRGDRIAGRHVAERIRRALARARRGGALPGISAGVSSFPRDAGSQEELVRTSDEALYAAKAAGKGRTSLYEALDPRLRSGSPA
ncbi:MAG: sensor domain-containing diguanylate cyclase [Actinobacteria bacterium]|nr:sensor domain-containing diguanylate cyclase [Actinomycetota bacterium]